MKISQIYSGTNEKESEIELYYSVLIEVSEIIGNKKNILQITLVDQTNIDKIKTEIVTPYINEEEFFMDGYSLKKSAISRIKIVSSERSIKSIVDLRNYQRRESNRTSNVAILICYTKAGIIQGDELVTDITNEILSEVKKELNTMNKKSNKSRSNFNNKKIFIVHGHDEKLKLEVARFIEKLGLEAIILSEQTNKGKTIMEKIEENTDVGYGIVLYTPCDKGGTFNTSYEDMKPRARQNVIFEHGYLIGKLGRERVCALVDENIEYPSDINGVVYISYQDQWQYKIVEELKSRLCQRFCVNSKPPKNANFW